MIAPFPTLFNICTIVDWVNYSPDVIKICKQHLGRIFFLEGTVSILKEGIFIYLTHHLLGFEPLNSFDIRNIAQIHVLIIDTDG